MSALRLKILHALLVVQILGALIAAFISDQGTMILMGISALLTFVIIQWRKRHILKA